MNHLRRKLLLGMTATLVTGQPLSAAARLTTPKQPAGPFYPTELPLDDDNDLTVVMGAEGRADGRISDLEGRIVDINGKPLQGMRIEIWQCDANGRYRHPYENGSRPRDENFQGHGYTITNRNGEYRFRTIRPVPYPGRTPHIHIAIFPPGEQPFVTQLYIENEPRNADDFLFNRVPEDRRHLVQAAFRPKQGSDAEFRAGFDIILNRANGTPDEG